MAWVAGVLFHGALGPCVENAEAGECLAHAFSTAPRLAEVKPRFPAEAFHPLCLLRLRYATKHVTGVAQLVRGGCKSTATLLS